MAQPLTVIRGLERELDETGQHLGRLIGQSIDGRKNELGTLAAQLEMMNPLSVLARGYSLTSDENGRLIVDSKQVSVGDRITSRLGNGLFNSRIEEIE